MSTQSISEMLRTVSQYAAKDDVQSIPKLATIDRKAIGWLRIALGGLLRFGWALFVLVVSLFVLSIWLSVTFQLLYQFLGARFPDWERPVMLVMIIVAGWIIYRAEGWQTFIGNDDIWTQADIEELPFRHFLSFYARLVQLTAALFVGSFLIYSLLPFVLVAFAALAYVQELFANWTQTVTFLQTFWLPALGFLVVVLLFVFLLRRASREKLLRYNIVILGGLGLLLIYEAFFLHLEPTWVQVSELWPFSVWENPQIDQSLPISQWIGLLYVSVTVLLWRFMLEYVYADQNNAILIFLVLSISYPLGLAYLLLYPFRIPYRSCYKAILWTAPCLRLRWRTSMALRYHKKRNRRQTDDDDWTSVCHIHLVRFITSTARCAYQYRLRYYHCPVCGSDNHLYTGVECIAMKFSLGMKVPQIQEGSTLYLNGLDWMHNHQDRVIPTFDALVIGETNNHDIDEFFAIYMNKEKEFTTYHKPLTSVTAQVISPNSLEVNERHLLEEQLSQVVFNSTSPTPCIQRIRLRDNLRRRNQRLRRAAVQVIRLIVFLFVLLGLYLAWSYFY